MANPQKKYELLPQNIIHITTLIIPLESNHKIFIIFILYVCMFVSDACNYSTGFSSHREKKGFFFFG
jgi:hypothetical protein